MRIAQLDLEAFGPFTGVRVDFGDPGGIDFVFGENEAGKSSCLRGLLDLLFGFPTRTPDAFLHPYPKLLIGAELLGNDGAPDSGRRARNAERAAR